MMNENLSYQIEYLGSEGGRLYYEEKSEKILNQVNTELIKHIQEIGQRINDAFHTGALSKDKYRENFDLLTEKSIELLGFDAMHVPEYYFEIKETIAQNQEVWDLMFGKGRFNLDQQIRDGRILEFPPIELVQKAKNEGNSLMLFNPDIPRGVFINLFVEQFRYLGNRNGYYEPFGEDVAGFDLKNTQAGNEQKNLSYPFLTNPILEPSNDPKFENIRYKPDSVNQKFVNLVNDAIQTEFPQARFRTLNLEEYLIFQAYSLLQSHPSIAQTGIEMGMMAADTEVHCKLPLEKIQTDMSDQCISIGWNPRKSNFEIMYEIISNSMVTNEMLRFMYRIQI